MVRFAFRNLLTRPMRSLLSLLGLTVAIMGMVGLFSVASGIDAMVTSTFRKVPGLVVMQPGAPIPIFSRLPAAWGDEIADLPGVHVVNREIWTRAHIIEGKPVISPPRFLFGMDIATRLKLTNCVYRKHVVAGRFLDLDDKGTLHAVISRQIAEEFGKSVGETLRVDGQSLEIVGIYHCDSLLLDVAIILDIGFVQALSRMDGNIASCFYVEANPNVDRKELAERIKSEFLGRPSVGFQLSAALSLGDAGGAKAGNPLIGLMSALDGMVKANSGSKPRSEEKPAGKTSTETESRPQAAVVTNGGSEHGGSDVDSDAPEESAVEVRTPDDWTEEFKRFSADLDIFLFLMTGLGVTIAVLSIVNTMLMSVTERFIEFGILKANGWSNGDVLRLVTLESALLGLAGGVLGSSIGWIVTLVVNANWPTRIHLYASAELLLFGIGFSTVLGILGGLYPSMWASRMMPMDAIRRG